MLRHLVLPVIFSLLAFVSLSAQQPEQSGVIKTAKGILIVWNEPGNYYTVEIPGNAIEPTHRENLWFNVDGKFLQILTTRKEQFAKNAQGDKDILVAHMNWESEYIAKTLDSKLKIESSRLKLANGTEALLWTFQMPKVSDTQTARKQLYLTVVKRDHIFLLNSVVNNGDDEKSVAKLLTDAMLTLKPTDRPLGIKKAQEQVIKGN